MTLLKFDTIFILCISRDKCLLILLKRVRHLEGSFRDPVNYTYSKSATNSKTI